MKFNFDFQTFFKIAGLIFMCGVFYAQLMAIRTDIARIEKKVEQHNNFDRRIVKLETMLEIAELKGTK